MKSLKNHLNLNFKSLSFLYCLNFLVGHSTAQDVKSSRYIRVFKDTSFDSKLLPHIIWDNPTGAYIYFMQSEELSDYVFQRFFVRIEGRFEGKYIINYDNGMPSIHGQFKEGKKDGIWHFWDKSGLLIRKEWWINGTLLRLENY